MDKKPEPAIIEKVKYLKTSQIVARSVVRLLLFMLLAAAGSYLLAPAATQTKMQHTYLVIHNKLTLIFPAVLVLGFAGLLILCIRTKYKEIEFNWLLVLNTAILMAFCIVLYVRILQLLK